MEKELASETRASLKKSDNGKIVSVNFSHALFSLLTTHDDLMMQAFGSA
jgi:hypothetical protein